MAKEKGYRLTENAVKRTAETVRRVLGDPILAVKKSAGQRVATASGEGVFWVKITSFAPIGNNRWQYTGTLMVHQNAGIFVEWNLDGGQFLTAIFNTCESFNNGTGLEGNSVNVTNLPAGFSLKPIQGEPVLRATRLGLNQDQTIDPWFVQYENAIDGVCPA